MSHYMWELTAKDLLKQVQAWRTQCKMLKGQIKDYEEKLEQLQNDVILKLALHRKALDGMPVGKAQISTTEQIAIHSSYKEDPEVKRWQSTIDNLKFELRRVEDGLSIYGIAKQCLTPVEKAFVALRYERGYDYGRLAEMELIKGDDKTRYALSTLANIHRRVLAKLDRVIHVPGMDQFVG